MKTEKQVRTWTIFDGHAEPKIQGPDIAYAENVKVIAFDDHKEIVAGLEARINRLRLALQKIADEDFRGNRPSGSVKAYQALKDDEEKT